MDIDLHRLTLWDPEMEERGGGSLLRISHLSKLGEKHTFAEVWRG